MLSDKELNLLASIFFGTKERANCYNHIGLFGQLLRKGLIDITGERKYAGLTKYHYTVSEEGRRRIEREIHKDPGRIADACESYLNWVPKAVPEILRTSIDHLPEALASDVPVIQCVAKLKLGHSKNGENRNNR